MSAATSYPPSSGALLPPHYKAGVITRAAARALASSSQPSSVAPPPASPPHAPPSPASPPPLPAPPAAPEGTLALGRAAAGYCTPMLGCVADTLELERALSPAPLSSPHAWRLPPVAWALLAHHAGPRCLFVPRANAYSRAQHRALWARLLPTAPEWAAVVAAADARGAEGFADACDALSQAYNKRSTNATAEPLYATGRYAESAWRSQTRQVAGGEGWTPAMQAAYDAAGGSALPLGYDVTYGALPQLADSVGAGEGGNRSAVEAVLVDIGASAGTTAHALRGIRDSSRPHHASNIGTPAGRAFALSRALSDAGLEMRNDSALTTAVVDDGRLARMLQHTGHGSGEDPTSTDAAAIRHVVEVMGEMDWLMSDELLDMSEEGNLPSLMRSYRLYPDAFASQAAYARSIRNAKLLVTEEYLDVNGEDARADVPPSLLRDLDAAVAAAGGAAAGQKRKRASLVITPGTVHTGGAQRRGGRGGACWSCGEVRSSYFGRRRGGAIRAVTPPS